MIELKVCPSTLAEGFSTYSPTARNELFYGKDVSHYIPVPSPDVDSEDAKEAVKNVGRISLSGAQPKFAVIIGDDLHLRYTTKGEQGTHMLKLRPTSYQIVNREYCVANENLTMQIASQAYKIETAANGLCFFSNNEVAYLTRRFDVFPGMGKYQQEDFASLLGYTKENGGSDFKYCNGSYEECAQVIDRYVKAALIDKLRFFRVILFNFITLNDDAHLKNFSLINLGGEYRLTPAYDLMNTSLHLYEPRIFALDKGLFKEGMSFSDVRSVGRADFIEFANRIGIPQKLAVRELDRFASENSLAEGLVHRSFLSEELKGDYLRLMAHRRNMLRDD